jgi:hypothetical protein
VVTVVQFPVWSGYVRWFVAALLVGWFVLRSLFVRVAFVRSRLVALVGFTFTRLRLFGSVFYCCVCLRLFVWFRVPHYFSRFVYLFWFTFTFPLFTFGWFGFQFVRFRWFSRLVIFTFTRLRLRSVYVSVYYVCFGLLLFPFAGFTFVVPGYVYRSFAFVSRQRSWFVRSTFSCVPLRSYCYRVWFAAVPLLLALVWFTVVWLRLLRLRIGFVPCICYNIPLLLLRCCCCCLLFILCLPFYDFRLIRYVVRSICCVVHCVVTFALVPHVVPLFVLFVRCTVIRSLFVGFHVFVYVRSHAFTLRSVRFVYGCLRSVRFPFLRLLFVRVAFGSRLRSVVAFGCLDSVYVRFAPAFSVHGYGLRFVTFVTLLRIAFVRLVLVYVLVDLRSTGCCCDLVGCYRVPSLVLFTVVTVCSRCSRSFFGCACCSAFVSFVVARSRSRSLRSVRLFVRFRVWFTFAFVRSFLRSVLGLLRFGYVRLLNLRSLFPVDYLSFVVCVVRYAFGFTFVFTFVVLIVGYTFPFVAFTFGWLLRFVRGFHVWLPSSFPFRCSRCLRCYVVRSFPSLFVRFAFHNVAFVRLLRFPRSVARLRFRCFARSFVTFVRYLLLSLRCCSFTFTFVLFSFRSFVCSRCTFVAVGWVDSVSFVALRFGCGFLTVPVVQFDVWVRCVLLPVVAVDCSITFRLRFSFRCTSVVGSRLRSFVLLFPC